MLTVASHGRTLNFETREGSTDPIVIREAFFENTYCLSEGDFGNTGVMVDIGANIGAVSLLAVALGAKKVLAFEPEPENFSLLQKNLELNSVDCVEAHQMAVWSSSTKIPLVPSQGGSTSDPHSVEVNKASVIQVQATTLKKILSEYDEIDVLKCDTEGAEYDILTDSEVLQKARKIVIEFHGTTKQRIGSLLATLLLTHNIHAFGRWVIGGGGQIYAQRY